MRGKDFRRHQVQRTRRKARNIVVGSWNENPDDPTTELMALKNADHLTSPPEVAKQKLPFDKKPIAIRAKITEGEFNTEL